jgi:hypothetical protein
MFTTSFWKDATERAVRVAATSFIGVVGGEAIIWNIGWQGLIGVPVTAAILDYAASLAFSGTGRKGTAGLIHVTGQTDDDETR